MINKTHAEKQQAKKLQANKKRAAAESHLYTLGLFPKDLNNLSKKIF